MLLESYQSNSARGPCWRLPKNLQTASLILLIFIILTFAHIDCLPPYGTQKKLHVVLTENIKLPGRLNFFVNF